MKKNSSGWTKHLPNTRAAMCLKVLPTHQHALSTIIILSAMEKIQLMVLQAASKENSSHLRNQEEKQSRVAQELFEFAANKLNTEEPEEGKCLHYRTRIKYFENITRGQINESKTIPKMHELHSIRSVGVENVVQTKNTTCCCLNCITGMGKCEFFEIASQWEFHSVVGEAFLTKPKINPAHRKINPKGTISDEQM